jgi:indolepyruvate ferredoxin oxidoreductase beta subunit
VLKRFQRKGEKLVELNRRAFEAGRAAVGEAAAALA